MHFCVSNSIVFCQIPKLFRNKKHLPEANILKKKAYTDIGYNILCFFNMNKPFKLWKWLKCVVSMVS